MNTKEAIKYLDDLQDENFELQEAYNNKRILEVIELLKHGEKYKAMWGELKSKYGIFFKDTEEGRCLGEMMGIFEYKHFPKPKPKLIKLLAELDKEVKEVLKELGG